MRTSAPSPTGIRIAFRTLIVVLICLILSADLNLTHLKPLKLLETQGTSFYSTASAKGEGAFNEQSSTASLYVIFLDGIQTSSNEANNVAKRFTNIINGLEAAGVPRDHFVYFSYSAVRESQGGSFYCAGWGVSGCSSTTRGDLRELNLAPVYESSDTQMSVKLQAEVLDWLIGQIIKKDPDAQIHLVGYSLGGIVASRWASTFGIIPAYKEQIRGIVLLESPVGGIPLAETSLIHVLQLLFGRTVLDELQLEFPAINSIDASIVDSLYIASTIFPVVSIESVNDYLVNAVGFPLCTDIACAPNAITKVPVGIGAKNWQTVIDSNNITIPTDIKLNTGDLGGEISAPVSYSQPQNIYNIIVANHTIPLTQSNLAALWAVEAILGNTSSTDVYLLVDLSSSYQDDLATFKIQAPSIINSLQTTNSDIRFGLARFEDYPISPFGSAGTGDRAYERIVDLTYDTNLVLNELRTLTVRWGNDGPESQLPALYQAATGLGQDLSRVGYPLASIPPGQGASFREDAIKVLLLWTDAPFHQPGDPGSIPYPGPSFEQTVQAILALSGIKVVGIYASDTAAASGAASVASPQDSSQATTAEAISDLEAFVIATGSFAPTEGVDCDGDGIIDIAGGEPLVCTISTTGAGIGEAVISLVETSTEPDKLFLPMLHRDATVTIQEKYPLSINIDGEGFVLTSPSSRDIPAGEPVFLSAVADSGWTFDSWDGDLSGRENPAILTMDEAHLVTARFVRATPPPYRYGHANTHGYIDTDAHTNGLAHQHAYLHTDQHADFYANTYCYRDSTR